MAQEGEADLERRCEGLNPAEANRLKRASPREHGWVIAGCLPHLMEGVVGMHFHGLISVATSILNISNPGGNGNILADALASFTFG